MALASMPVSKFESDAKKEQRTQIEYQRINHCGATDKTL